MQALADVLAFATGRIRSNDAKVLQEYAPNVKVLTDNVGLIGWSAGGNLAVLTMAEHGSQFPELAWYASWESPVLSNVDGGWGSIYEPDPFYDPTTGRIDFKRLRYNPEMPLWVWPPQRLAKDPNWPRGGLYLDGDGNGIFNQDADYGFWVAFVSPDVGQPRKAFYTPAVTREARDRKVFRDKWPSHIATLEEVEHRANREDALRHIPEVVRRLPRMAVLVFESEVGHVTAAADHPHAIAQVNAWLDARTRWVRFNPDVHYVESVMGRKMAREVQYPAGRRLDRQDILTLVEPEETAGGPSDAQGMAAAACELADRTNRNVWESVLPKVLIQ